MTGHVIFLTHGDVVVDPNVAVPDWGLNDTGRARHATFAQHSMLDNVVAVFSSTERKAREGAAPVALRLNLQHQTLEALGENDRSATGYLPEVEFWPVVEAFFAKPDVSVRGWETARDAQHRILEAVRLVIEKAPDGDVLIVSHGGVGNLLRCALLGKDISQSEAQPHPKGGCWFRFSRSLSAAPTDWETI